MSLSEDEDLKINSELYAALMLGNDAKVIAICQSLSKGPLHTLTIHEDTVLHMATYHKKNGLVLELLRMLPRCDYHKLIWQNNGGNTILHETGTNNRTVEVAAEMLSMAPMLLSMWNKQGETPLFYAARHGKTKIFKFLHAEVCRTIQGPDLKTFLRRDDKSTILHQAVLSRNYWVAHEIAVTHKNLIDDEDEDEMTPLELLSCSPPEFRPKSFWMRIIYGLIDSDIEDTSKMFSVFKKMRKRKHNYEWAMKLVQLLVKADTSWVATASSMDKRRTKIHQYGKTTQQEIKTRSMAKTHESDSRGPDTPLLLATKSGCTEIVEEILKVYPQAVEHVNQDGRNILHLAILHRSNDIIDLVLNMEFPKDRLRGKIDNEANSLLHMVGEEHDEVTIKEDVKGPAFELQENTLLFKKVKEEICTTLDPMKLNSKSKTAERLFNEKNHQLRLEAKDWMSKNAENCSIVAVLIATVAFTAAYTVPGGADTATGTPFLKHRPLFLIFTISDAISLSSSLTSVIIFLNIITSPFRFEDFRASLPMKLTFGLTLLIFSVAMLMVAFAATLILTISSGRKWTDMILYGISFFPVFVFVFSYATRYKKLAVHVYRAVKQMTEQTIKVFSDA